MTYTQSHCGANGFSPPAPDCHHTVPEPGTWGLLVLGLVIALFLKRFFDGRR